MKTFLLSVILLLNALSPPQSKGPDSGPSSLAPGEVAALVRECGERTTRMARRVIDYTYTESVIEYEVDEGGRVRREKSKVFEVYPVRGRRWVSVQVSEDGTALSAAKVERERARAAKRLAEAEEEAAPEQKRTATASNVQPPGTRFTTFGIGVEQHKRGGLSKTHWFIRPTDFFVSHEFYAPRRAALGGREAILLSFRPRADYVYDRTNVPFKDGVEDYGRVMAQLGGKVWIDAADKILVRLEAVPVGESGGAGAPPGDAPNADAPIVFELTRLPDGLWVPARSRYNSYGRENVFWQTTISRAREYRDFKLFSTSVKGIQLDPPRAQP